MSEEIEDGVVFVQLLPPPVLAAENKFNYLADESIVRILGFLPAHSIVRVGATCKRLFFVARQPSVWKQMCVIEQFKVAEMEAEEKGITWGRLVLDIVTSHAFVWGNSLYGQLGLGGTVNRTVPTRCNALDACAVRQLFHGNLHSACVTYDGDLLTWGWGFADQLGHGGLESFETPKVVQVFSRITIRQIACGKDHSAFVSYMGDVYTCGQGRFGALGHGDWQDVDKPKRVDHFDMEKVTRVACGTGFTVLLTAFNDVYVWGKGSEGQLGLHDSNSRCTPEILNGLKNKAICQLVCGTQHVFALSQFGDVWTWGCSDDGRLGIDTDNIVMEPAQIAYFFENSKNIAQISAFSTHSAAVTDKGELYVWGANWHGQLGLGDTIVRRIPVLLNYFTERKVRVIQVACGNSHTIALCKMSKLGGGHQAVFTWGSDYFGQLGSGDCGQDVLIPQNVSTLQGHRVVEISAGANHSGCICAWNLGQPTQRTFYGLTERTRGELGRI